MIIGNSKKAVIENIKKAIENDEHDKKVEVGDPDLTKEQKREIVESYIKNKDKISYKIKNKIARIIINAVSCVQNKETQVTGIENIKDIKTGAIITSNHFNPLDSTVVQTAMKKVGKNRIYIVGQEENLAMQGFIGFIMNYADIIPISSQISYMKKGFPELIQNRLQKNDYILIYPEQEMWFNYKKPRRLKQGAYYFAAKNNVPIISCFVEMQEKSEKDNNEFYKVKYIIHILPPIYPEKGKSIKENSITMMEKDYKQKQEAYEKVYNKKLDYTFSVEDIAGWIDC